MQLILPQNNSQAICILLYNSFLDKTENHQYLRRCQDRYKYVTMDNELRKHIHSLPRLSKILDV
jgi:hypothetical protein